MIQKRIIFGQFLVKMERDIKIWYYLAHTATAPMLKGYKIYFNPLLFLECNKEMIALFKHEIYHIMYGHHERGEQK